MEFGSLGLGFPPQSASNQTGASGLGQTATIDTNPENTVTPVANGEALQNDRRQDQLGRDDTQSLRSDQQATRAPEDLSLLGFRTTLNFDSEQNRIFLQIVNTDTEEVIEQIPSDQLVEFVRNALDSGQDNETSESGAPPAKTVLAV